MLNHTSNLGHRMKCQSVHTDTMKMMYTWVQGMLIYKKLTSNNTNVKHESTGWMLSHPATTVNLVPSLILMDNSVCRGYPLDGRRLKAPFQKGERDFLSCTAFKPALGPTQPHTQWVPGDISLGVKLQGV
jgi:hypothetical protein